MTGKNQAGGQGDYCWPKNKRPGIGVPVNAGELISCILLTARHILFHHHTTFFPWPLVTSEIEGRRTSGRWKRLKVVDGG